METWKDELFADKLLSLIYHKIKAYDKRILELKYNLKIAIAKGKTRMQKRIARRLVRTYKAKENLNNATDEIAEIKFSSVTFTFEKIKYGGKTIKKDGVIVFQYFNPAIAIHEMKHGFQYLNGQLVPGSNSSQPRYYDLNDEVEAYIRQYYIDSNSLPEPVSSVENITTDYVKNIKNKVHGTFPYADLPSKILNLPYYPRVKSNNDLFFPVYHQKINIIKLTR